jgi:metal-dependent hydrolase (beta-lactamase superfamily II)
MVEAARDSADGDILLVMGGFHLEWATTGKIQKVISAFRQLHVQYVGPCHCCGHRARSLFERCYGKNYINIGAGKVIAVAKLPSPGYRDAQSGVCD